jgi:lipoyl synthase
MSSLRSNDLKTLEGIDFSPQDKLLFQKAWNAARASHGKDFTFYLPGMIRCGHERGRYPALSLTGNRCELLCEHCKGRLLEPMIQIRDPAHLCRVSARLKEKGAHGILLSGGSDVSGRLPWERFYEAIARTHEETELFMSAHVGFSDLATCQRLKQAGVKQALMDVMGDQETATRVYHLENEDVVIDALESISQSGLALAPHVVAGLFYGRLRGEKKALEIISRYKPDVLVMVVLSPFKGTPMASAVPPSPLEVARLMATARLLMPEVPIALGCERPRNRQGWILEKLALRAGATRMAVWSDEAVQEALRLGLEPRFQLTCCSVPFREDFAKPAEEFATDTLRPSHRREPKERREKH